MNTRRWRLPMLAALLLSITFWGWLFLASPGQASTAQVCPPVASTQYFTFVYGSVTLNSTAGRVGAIVEARSPRGDTVGCTMVETAGLYPLMYIYGEETLGGQTTPGMRTNEAVSFYVDGIAATPSPAFTWVNSWQSTRVDLSATGDIPAPTAEFTTTPTSGVAPLAVQFTDVSTGSITSRSWSFGDGGTSTAQNPSYTYTTPGVYTVTLTVTGPGGSDTETKTSHITVSHPPPVADFTGSPTSGVAPLAVQFTDVSTGTITSRSWSFGDGGTSTAQNPSHTFATAGVYTVALTVTGPGGSNTKSRASYITVTEVQPVTPVANFTASPTTGVAPLTVQFTDVSTGTITSRSWSFGDGGASTAQNPSHTFTAAGVYTVTLTVTGPGGSNTKSRASYITVTELQPVAPVADFTASPTTGVAPLTVQFTDVSTGTITSRSWSFGDGGTSTAQNPSHSYETPGVYTITLSVTGPGGSDTNTKASYITVNQNVEPPPTPVASFTATPDQGTAPLSVQFNDTSTGVITTWVWSFGNGANSNERHPVYTYTVAGVYTVTLNVSGPHGWSSAAQPVRVAPPLPTFTDEPAPANGLTVHFTFDPPPGVTRWLWEFGDGETSTEQNPVYTYAAPGDYGVRLTVYTVDGLSATHERTVQVQGGSSQTEFSLYLPSVIR